MRKNTTHHRLTSVSVIGGFLDGTELALHEGLNCFIGARGAGKTTVLEMIRYAMNVMPESPAERRRVEALLKANLESGRIQLAITTKDGVELLIHRSVGEEPIVLTKEGKPTNIAIKHLLRVDVYSQNEVERIATDRHAQMAIMDRFQSDRIAGVARRLRDVYSALAANRAKLVPLLKQSEVLARELDRLPAVATRLESLAAGGGPNREAINEAHARKALRDREQRHLAGTDSVLESLSGRVVGLRGDLQNGNAPFVSSDGTNRTLMDEAATILSDCLGEVSQALSRAIEHIPKARDQLRAVREQLDLAHKQQELEFRQLIEKHREAQALVVERVSAERERNELFGLQAERLELARQIEQLEAARMELVEDLSNLRDERFAIRSEIVAFINEQLADRICVKLVQLGNDAPYREYLEEKLAGCHVKRNQVAARVTTMRPASLVETLKDADVTRLVDITGVNAEQAGKVIDAMKDPDTLLELDELPLDDETIITLRDGEVFKRSEDLSTGQKCTAVLPILLLESDAPLLVDQPEDNIDNSFISSTIVDSLRRVRPHRQLIFVTHNPNIPVLGEADCVFVLNSDGERSQAVNVGSVDDCKEDIVRLLEGGESAFKARKRRYAY